MLIGDTFYIDETIIESFKKSGISHLLAVSGTNISYVILASKFIFDKLFGKSISNFFSMIFIIIFVILSGASPSVVRAGLMAIILIISNILSRKSNMASTISITALIMLFYNPFILCDCGFILSFGGTIGIVCLYKAVKEAVYSKFSFVSSNKYCSLIIDSFCLTLSAQIILFPIMLYFFNSISIISIFTNIVICPFVGYITILGIVICALGVISIKFAQILSFCTYSLLKLTILISNFCSQIPYGNLIIPRPSIFTILLYYLILLLIFTKDKISNKVIRAIKITMSFIILIIIISHLPKDFAELNMIDVGQGDSFHIKTKNGKNILVDCGGSESSDYDVGEKVLIPYLLNNTNGVIDILFISHFHEDHAEGAISVLESLMVKKVIIGYQNEINNLYLEIAKICSEKNIPIIFVKKGDKIIFDDITFEILFPSNDFTSANLNNNSLIIKTNIFDTKILFTGDAEIEEEQLLLKYYGSSNVLDVDILKVGHHGSRGSSSSDFLDKVSPKLSLISCGINNKFNHPHDEVLNRFNKFNEFILRTDENGQIKVKIYKNNIIKILTAIE